MSDRDAPRGHRDTIELGAASSLARGVLIGDRYRVVGRLGEGGMGVVYEVEDEHLEERVALKLLHAHMWADRDYRAQLRREVRLARRVSHPNVCRVHDLGHHQEALFVTMELIRGYSLRMMLADGATPQLAKKIDILIQLCTGLSAAHRAGVLHRDVKPDNVLVSGERAVLTDFGVAALVDGEGGRNFAGTMAYMAPELASGGVPDRACDVYSTAVVAFELLSGQVPFPIENIADCLAHGQDPHGYPKLHRGSAPPALREALDSVLAAGLSVDPTSRPADIEKFAEALARASRGEIASSPRLARGTTSRRRRETEHAGLRARVVTFMTFIGSAATDVDALERTISDWGGYVVSSEEVGVRAVFGAPSARGDDALRAARAGLDLIVRFGGMSAIDTRRQAFQLAVDGSLIGLDEGFATLEALIAGPGELGCSAASTRHIAGHFLAVPRGVDHDGRDRFAVMPKRAASAGQSPFVGRQRELDELHAAVRIAFEERRPIIAQITGEAGIGKSRLHAELARRISAQREVDWLVGHGSPVAEAAPLLVLRSAELSWYRAVRRAPTGEGANGEAAARAWLLKRAARRPVVFVVEDAHWADEATLAFVSALTRSARSSPIAVLVVSRVAVMKDATEIKLGVLERGDAAHLARKLSPSSDPSAIGEISARAGGNPLFICELATQLASGVASVPETVEAALQGRTDRLSEDARRVLDAASIIESEVSIEAVAALCAPITDAPGAFENELTGLVVDGMLLAAGSSDLYRFGSPLLRDVVYGQIDPDEKRAMHASFAAFLESQSEPCPGHAAALGHHWLAADEEDKARLAYRRAGQEALSLLAYRDALAALEIAERLTPEVDRDAELLELVGDALLSRDANAADRRYRGALAARREDEIEARAALSVKLAVTSSAMADHLEAVRYLEAGLVLAESSDAVSISTKARILAQLGWVLGYVLGDNERGLCCSEEAVALLEKTTDTRALARALGRLGANYMRAGRWRAQLRCNLKNLELARQLGDVRGLLSANVNLGVTYTSLGDLDVALEHTFAALEISTREGHTQLEPLVRNNLAGLLFDTGDLEAADSQVDAAIEMAASVGHLDVLPEAYCIASRLAVARGDLATAEDKARTALEHARGSGSTIDAGIALRHLGVILGRRGQRDEAATQFAEAGAILESADGYELARTQVAEGRFLGKSESSADWRRGAALLAKGKATLERLGAALDLARLEDEDDLR